MELSMSKMSEFWYSSSKYMSKGDRPVKSPLPNPPRRITFYPPDETGWNWRLELSFDGENWTEVYRMRATPRQ